MNAHERWSEDVAPYLLGALEAHETEAFEAHVAQCAVCSEDVARLQPVSEVLPATVLQLEAPPELRDRVMTIVRREAQLLNAATAPEPEPATSPRQRWWRGWFAPLAGGLAAAAVTAAFVLGGDSTRIVPAKSELAGARVQLELGDSDSRLVARDLPAPPDGRVYQVWIKRPGRAPEPTDALFLPDRDGSASVAMPGDIKGVEAILVTDEPRGGSRVPTRQPVISAVPA